MDFQHEKGRIFALDADGKLHEGQYVPEDILNKYVLLSAANGVVPGADVKRKTEE